MDLIPNNRAGAYEIYATKKGELFMKHGKDDAWKGKSCLIQDHDGDCWLLKPGDYIGKFPDDACKIGTFILCD